MNEITIVKRRPRVMPFLLTLLVVALLVLAGLWMLGLLPGVAPARLDVLNDAGGNRPVYQTQLSDSHSLHISR
jgi:hypothetical protein